MIGVIPNPKKSLSLGRKNSEVYQALANMYLFSDKYRLTKTVPSFNQVTYETTEFLSAGVYIDINSIPVSDNQTEITIEVRRKIGSFDKSFEVNLANDHIQKITDLLAQTLEKTPEELTAIIENRNAIIAKEEAEKARQIEEAKRKSEELRLNNPVKYYFQQIAIWIVILLMFGGLIYVAYLAFS